MTEVLLVLLGFFLGLLPTLGERRRRSKAHWRALEAEAELCREMADAYRSATTQVLKPLYRLPLTSYQNSFPVLLSDGAVDTRGVQAITRFFNQVEQLNRGLDLIADVEGPDEFALELMMAESSMVRPAIFDEHDRNRLKAEKLSSIGEHYRELRAVLDSHR